MTEILIKGLIGLVLILAYLGFSFIIGVIFGRAAASANDVHPSGDPMVTERLGGDQDLPASVTPNDELMYQAVERFDDPEGDL
jgi:hypothetical protein